MPNIFNLRFLIAVLGAGLAVNAIANGKLDFQNGKFLGLVEEPADTTGIGLDDFAKGAVVVLAGKLAANFLGPKLG